MITINYIGGFGNNLFQYVFARLHAESNNILLHTTWPHESILSIKNNNVDTIEEISKKETFKIDENFYQSHLKTHGSVPIKLNNDKNYIFDGFFQDADLMNSNIQTIKNYFNLPHFDKTNNTQVSIRMGDFLHNGYNSEIISPEWFNKAMELMPNEKFVIVNDNPHSRFKKDEVYITKQKIFFEKLKGYTNLTNQDIGAKRRFENFFKYENLICDNSCFTWWGAFLSDAENIVTMKEAGFFGVNSLTWHGNNYNLWNIKNISRSVSGQFINILELN